MIKEVNVLPYKEDFETVVISHMVRIKTFPLEKGEYRGGILNVGENNLYCLREVTSKEIAKNSFWFLRNDNKQCKPLMVCSIDVDGNQKWIVTPEDIPLFKHDADEVAIKTFNLVVGVQFYHLDWWKRWEEWEIKRKPDVSEFYQSNHITK